MSNTRIPRHIQRRLTHVKRAQWRRKRAKQQKGLCYYCRKPMKQATLDHVVPLSKGGRDHFENVVAACLGCNRSKADKQKPEF